MQIDSISTSTKKGITPIIATVLLLGITVAIGLTVYTQAQGLLEGAGNTDTFDKVRATSIALSPVYGANGVMDLQVTNKGDRAINVSKFTIQYGPPNWDPVSYQTLAAQTSWTNGADANKCFNSQMAGQSSTMDNAILEPGERAGCSTGIDFPSALESVEIKVEADGFDYSTSYTCSVESSSSRTC